ncbi:DUF4249 domain-containing protein [Marivirga sp.]|uniref:DUF4249 domain-containing protein n=1 Tax=Marivirga sp. TaxID=2018662 RepID=UPI0025EE4388|nr:DUF4249 domain-containing protein [Marivirga sp.]
MMNNFSKLSSLNRNLKGIAFLIILFSCVSACIDPIFFETNNSDPLLVVDGQLITGVNNGEVKLFTSTKYVSDPNDFTAPRMVSDASVYVNDVLSGKRSQLKFNTDHYELDDESFEVVVGGEYFLEIIWNDQTYRSQKERIVEAPKIDSIYYNYKSVDKTIDVYVDARTDVESLVQWKWSGAYQVISFLPSEPDTFTCCTRCYVEVTGKELNIVERNIDIQQSIKEVLITTLKVDMPTEFLINLQQLSLTQEAHEYLNLLKIQKSSGNSLFDPPPFEINGNLVNVDNPNEKVLGYFFASDQDTKSIKIDRREFFIATPNYRSFVGDCRDIIRADTIIPPNWSGN